MRNKVYEKFPVNVEVKFLFENKVYSGTALKLLKKIMLIHAEWDFPADFQKEFEVLILHKEKRMMVPVRIEKLAATDKYSNVITVEVLNPPKDYLELVGSRRTVYKIYSSITRRLLRK